MAWELLPVDYTDAVWSGLKRYSQIDNEDGTISLQDVTVYTNKEKSFFGAIQANRMNEALNTIMSMVENGTDLYEAFQNYFAEQKLLFEGKENTEYNHFVAYTDNLKAEGDEIIATIKTDYRAEIESYENIQEQVFTAWFQAMKDQLSQDAAGNLQNEIDHANEVAFNRYYGLVSKTTSINKDSSGTVTSIVETGDGVLCTTTFGKTSEGKVITTVVQPENATYKYIKTVLIKTVSSGKEITESYTKEGI